MMPLVATYETILTIPRPIEETFAFVSDFRNAARWDPRTYSAHKTTDGPIGVGTRFMLTGGMMPGSVVKRLHLPESVAGMSLPYNVVAFDAPNEFTLKGESRMLRWCDHLKFTADGDSTRLSYFAELEMKRFSAAGDALITRMFQRIGDDATADIPEAVVRGA
jgi:hypothetical protein